MWWDTDANPAVLNIRVASEWLPIGGGGGNASFEQLFSRDIDITTANNWVSTQYTLTDANIEDTDMFIVSSGDSSATISEIRYRAQVFMGVDFKSLDASTVGGSNAAANGILLPQFGANRDAYIGKTAAGLWLYSSQGSILDPTPLTIWRFRVSGTSSGGGGASRRMQWVDDDVTLNIANTFSQSSIILTDDDIEDTDLFNFEFGLFATGAGRGAGETISGKEFKSITAGTSGGTRSNANSIRFQIATPDASNANQRTFYSVSRTTAGNVLLTSNSNGRDAAPFTITRI